MSRTRWPGACPPSGKDSSIFLFDEPLSNLDAKLRGQMRAELASMSQRVRKNTIYVTHDRIEAMNLADPIVVMHGGYIQQQGNPEELFKRPANKFVAGFLGSPPMNFLNGEIQNRDGAVLVSVQGFDLNITGPKADAARKHGQKSAIPGVRPSDLLYSPDAPADEALSLDVAVSEYVGAQSVLFYTCGAADVTVEIASDTPVALGRRLTFAVNPAGVHLFDKDSEHVL